MYLDRVTNGYVECALWSSTFPDSDVGKPLDDVYTTEDFTPEALAEMRAQCEDFIGLCEREGVDLTALEPEQVGHDFWLTRNRHGAGFWDRGLGELGDRLTVLAQSYGEGYVWPNGNVLEVQI